VIIDSPDEVAAVVRQLQPAVWAPASPAGRGGLYCGAITPATVMP
jgi:hypothetical protein